MSSSNAVKLVGKDDEILNPAIEEKQDALIASLSDSLSNYHASDEDNTATHDYYGYVTKDGAWAIEQIDNVTMAHRYIKGASDYTTSWITRLSLTYGLFNDIF